MEFNEAVKKYGMVLSEEMARIKQPYRSAILAARKLNELRVYRLPAKLSDGALIKAVGERVIRGQKKWSKRSTAWRDNHVSSGPASPVRVLMKDGKPLVKDDG